jgi:hypothetical protein
MGLERRGVGRVTAGAVDWRDPAALERAGDAAVATAEPALAYYQAALELLPPTDPAYDRVSTKLNRTPWDQLARQRRFEDAMVLLKPEALRNVGMGHYAPAGAGAEALADAIATGGDPSRALPQYWTAVKYFLLYAAFPARGDSEYVGYDGAEQVLLKIEKIEEARSAQSQ